MIKLNWLEKETIWRINDSEVEKIIGLDFEKLKIASIVQQGIKCYH